MNKPEIGVPRIRVIGEGEGARVVEWIDDRDMLHQWFIDNRNVFIRPADPMKAAEALLGQPAQGLLRFPQDAFSADIHPEQLPEVFSSLCTDDVELIAARDALLAAAATTVASRSAPRPVASAVGRRTSGCLTFPVVVIVCLGAIAVCLAN